MAHTNAAACARRKKNAENSLDLLSGLLKADVSMLLLTIDCKYIY
jgi:hypothetical protein